MAMTPRQALSRFGFTPTRSLGQNFLFDEGILSAMADAAGIEPGDRVLEVGAGAGTLTRVLAGRGARVVTLEVDEALRPVLEQTLEGLDVQVLFADAARVRWPALHREYLAGEPFKIVANLPYYITSPLLMAWLSPDLPVLSMTVMVQREAALRLLAGPGTKDYGPLPVLLACYTHTHAVTDVPAAAFEPVPGVDSTVLTMEFLSQPTVSVPERALFTQVVRSAFCQRRKQVANSLSAGLGLSREKGRQLLKQAGVPATARAEDLSLEQLAAVARVWAQDRPNT